nr:hypothetical protein CR513_60246 [Ipomoea batatas]
MQESRTSGAPLFSFQVHAAFPEQQLIQLFELFCTVIHNTKVLHTIIPAASAGDTCDAEFCLSEGLDTLKLPEELGLGVVGREELGELTTDDGYHDSVEQSGNLGESNCDVEWRREFKSSMIAVLSSSLSLFSLRISFELPGKSVSMYLRVLVDL